MTRPRLLAVLSHGVGRTPVTLISGPAGSGKTTLAASWVRARADGIACAWFSLDEADDDPAPFWAYAAAALAGAGVDLSEVSPPRDGEPTDTAFPAALAARVLACRRPVALVLDNADTLTDPGVCRALDLVVRRAGGRLRLVLCAREEPRLPLHRYRVAGSLSEIGGPALAFTDDETRDLLARLGAPLGPQVVADLRARTGGWPVALRLAAAPLKHGAEPERLVASLVAEGGSIAQYLVGEVLESRPAPVRRFLHRISVTAELWPELVERLGPGGSGHRMLASLARANAFVEQAPDAPGGYRIHPLFRELLRTRLADDHPREFRALHRVCASWYAQAGRLPEAAEHAIAAGDWPLTASLLVDDLATGALLAHPADPHLQTMSDLPCPGADDAVAVTRLAVALSTRRPVCPEDLALARAAAADTDNKLSLRVCAGVAAAAGDAWLGAPSDRVAAEADAAGRLLAELAPSRAGRLRELAAAVEAARSFALLRTDASDAELLGGLRAAQTASAAARSTRLQGWVMGQLTLVEALRGDLCSTAALLRDGEAAGPATIRPGRSAAGTVALAWACSERYDHAGARRWMAGAPEFADDAESRLLVPLLGVLHSRLLRVRHEFDAAGGVLRPYLRDGALPRWVRAQVVAEQARVHLAAGSPDDAARVLDGEGAPWAVLLRGVAAVLAGDPPVPLPAADPEQSRAVVVEAEILRAAQALQAGAAPAAVEALDRALRVAGPATLRRPFVDAPPQVRRLLRSQPRLARTAAWLNPSSGTGPDCRRCAGAAPAPTAPAAGASPPLSERELEVLQHVSQLLSTTEIAAAMFVSVTTVRSHIRSILRKLAVNGRNQAVRRGRELELI